MKKHKFTWLDGLVLAVVILLIAGTCIKFFAKETTSVIQETAEFQYQLQITNIRDFTADALEIGDTVYEGENKAAIGVITDILVEPATSNITTRDGVIRQVEVEDRYNVTLTLSAQGVVSGKTYKVGTFPLYVNHTGSFFTKYSGWSARIISID